MKIHNTWHKELLLTDFWTNTFKWFRTFFYSDMVQSFPFLSCYQIEEIKLNCFCECFEEQVAGTKLVSMSGWKLGNISNCFLEFRLRQPHLINCCTEHGYSLLTSVTTWDEVGIRARVTRQRYTHFFFLVLDCTVLYIWSVWRHTLQHIAVLSR